MATILGTSPGVEFLDLSSNPIDDSSGKFCALLKQCMQNQLVHVRLPASVLSTAPESIALDMFACMSMLQTLDISGSVLTERMCTEFIGHLQHMSGLQHLGLWGVMLTSHGGSKSPTMVLGDRPRDPQTGAPVCSMHAHVDGIFKTLPEMTSLEIGPTSAHLRHAGALLPFHCALARTA